MAYQTPNTVVVGDPVKKDDYDKLKGNSIDHETRVSALEVGAATIIIFKSQISNLSQYVNSTSTLTALFRYQAEQALTLSSAVLTDTEGATSGTFEFEIKKSTTIGGTYTTVFSTLPSLTADGSPKESSNAAFSTTAVAAGDWLELSVTSVAVGAKNINVSLTAAAA